MFALQGRDQGGIHVAIGGQHIANEAVAVGAHLGGKALGGPPLIVVKGGIYLDAAAEDRQEGVRHKIAHVVGVQLLLCCAAIGAQVVEEIEGDKLCHIGRFGD